MYSFSTDVANQVEQSALQMGTGLFVLLMQDVCDATFHCSQLLVHVVQELVQVRSIELTALYQNLQEGSGIEPLGRVHVVFTQHKETNQVSSMLHLGTCVSVPSQQRNDALNYLSASRHTGVVCSSLVI